LFDSVRSSSSRENCADDVNARPDGVGFTVDQRRRANVCRGKSDRRRPIDGAQSRNLIMTRTMRAGLLIAAAFVALVPLRAVAQDRVDPKASQREEPVRVQVNVNLFFPGPTGESEEAVRLRDRVRRSIYEMAGNECALIEQVLAKTCRLEGVNVNINRQSGQGEGYQASGNFTLRITLK
jgi:hypothetical protein